MSIKKATTVGGLALALVGSLALSACSSDSDSGSGKVTLRFTWWGADERAERYQQAIELFEQDHPDIKVETSFTDFADYWTQRNTDGTSGDLPDVLQMDMSQLQAFGKTGLLYDLGEFEGNQLDTSQIDETLLASGKVDDQLVAIPTGTNTLALHYNPDLLDQLGIDPPEWDYTWEDLNEFIAEVSEAGASQDPVVYGNGDYTTVWWMFMQWLVQQGIEPFAENGEMNFTEDDMRAFLNVNEELRGQDGMLFPMARADQLAPLSGFAAGESATEFNWDNFINSYAHDLDNQNIRMLPVPTGPDGQKHMFFKPTMLLSMGANTGHPEEAAELIDFLINDPEAGQIIGTDLGVPASQGRLDAFQPEEGSLDQVVIDFEDQAREQGAISDPLPLEPQGFGDLENEYVVVLGNEFGYGRLSVDDFVDRWFSESENLLVTD